MASAEDTPDTVSDGQVLGSILGLMNWTGEAQILGVIDPIMKAEGIEVLSEAKGIIEVLLVPDADDRNSVSVLHRAQILRPHQ